VIRVEHLCKSFDGRQILNNVSTTFNAGQINAVIGKSGSGKSVLIKSVTGLHSIDSGNVFYDDTNLIGLRKNDRKNLLKQIGMLFQGCALFDSLTIEENVMFPLDIHTTQTRAEKLKRVNFCLERVNMPNTNHLFPSEISGGMQKRVAIARAIVLNPKYLFCDEPNSGLDPQTSMVIDQLIKEITQEYNITTVMNTHDMNSIFEVSDQVAFIYQGQLWWNGPRNQLTKTDNAELNDFLFSSPLLRNKKGSS